MNIADLYERTDSRLPTGFGITPKELTHAVLFALSERLTPDEAVELGAELPEELGDVLAGAVGDGRFDRDELIETVASRLDLDDGDAETGTCAVLVALRELLEPLVAIEQVLEALPPDLAQLMHSA